MSLWQEKFQDIQDFRDQYLAIRKLCIESGLSFGQCKNDAKAILATEGVKKLTSEQLKEALDCVEEEHHTIIFFNINLTNKNMES